MTKVPEKFIPGLFRVARRSRRFAAGLVFVAYIILAPAFIAFLVFYKGSAFSLAVALKGAGIGGDVMGLSVLIFSTAVAAYSYGRYRRLFMPEAVREHPNVSEKEIEERYLSPYFGALQQEANVVLKAAVGATLLAIGTVLRVIGDFV